MVMNTFEAEQLIKEKPVADSTPASILRCPVGSILPRPSVWIVVKIGIENIDSCSRLFKKTSQFQGQPCCIGQCKNDSK